MRQVGKLCRREDIESYDALDVQAPASTLRGVIERHASSPLFMAVEQMLQAREIEEAERSRIRAGSAVEACN